MRVVGISELMPIASALWCCVITETVCANFCSQMATFYDHESRPQAHHRASSQEFGISRLAKSLHCCVKNYRSILWFKEGVPYPWNEDTSNLIVDTESRNQTIHVKSLSTEDGGNYSCVIVMPDSRTFTRQISLRVFDNGYSGMPMHTFVEDRSVAVHIGSNFQLYCEAFVGKIDLPDAQNKINWFKVDANDTLSSSFNTSRWRLQKIVKDDGLTLGLYLIADNVQPTDLGEYVCSASNAADQITRVYTKLTNIIDNQSTCCPTRWTIIYAAIFVSLLLLGVGAYLLYRKYVYGIRACWQQYNTFEKYDDCKDYDVFILYEIREMNFVSAVLIPNLNHEHDYVMSSQVFQKDTVVDMECRARISASRCLLLVLSSPYGSEDENRFAQILRSTCHLHADVICLIVRENDTNRFSNTVEFGEFAERATFIEMDTNAEDCSKLCYTLRSRLDTKLKIFDSTNSERYSTVNDGYVVHFCSVL